METIAINKPARPQGAVPTSKIKHLHDRMGCVGAKDGLKKVDFEPTAFIYSALLLEGEIHVVG